MSTTYILVVVSKDLIYTTFWKTIHYKSKVNDSNCYDMINEAKAVAFDLFTSPFHSECIVKKIVTSRKVNDEIIFSLLDKIDNDYYTTDNLEIILNNIIDEFSDKKTND